MNILYNGAFDGNLNWWTGAGTISRSLGYPRLGCVQLAAGQSIGQQAGLSSDALYTVHFFFRPAAGASLTVTFGSVTQTFAGVTDAWNEARMIFSLDSGQSDDLEFSASVGTVYVDSVSLIAGSLPIIRSEIATNLSSRLGDLATDAAISTTASGDKPDGDYSAAIDEALRAIGAVDIYGTHDVTGVEPSQVNDLIESAYTSMLQILRASYALQTDVTLGPRRESRSQIAASIDAMLGGGGSGGGNKRISVGNLARAGGWER